jgi:deazaflavin-dependent oxidoreductase (nitroreductase family)
MTDVTRYARGKTITLTTIGRKSGERRPVTIWFVVSGPNEILVQHASAPVANWYRNLQKNPEVTVDFGDGPIAGVAEPITDPAEIQKVLQRVRAKHWVAGPLIQFLGRKAEKVAARIRFV